MCLRVLLGHAANPAVLATPLRSALLHSAIDLSTLLPHQMDTFIDSLPSELLGDIFSQYLRGSLQPGMGHKCKSRLTMRHPDWKHAWKAEEVSRITDPVILSHVCSSWRRLTHATLSLWSVVMVWGDISRRDVQMLRFWLELSQSAPLQMCLYQVCDASKTPAKEAWREALAEAGDACGGGGGVAFVPQTLNILTSGRFRRQYQDPDDRWELYGKISTSTDKLRCISADRYFHRWGRKPGVPLHSLKEIRLMSGGVAYVRFAEVLGPCTSLEVLRISLLFDQPLPNLSPSSSTLQFLDLAVGADPGDIINSLILPALNCLRILIVSFDDEEKDLAAIERFSARHPDCRLQEFHYSRRFGDESSDNFLTVVALPLFQNLRRLYLDVRMSDRTLEALSFTSASQLLPHLEFISLENCHPTDGTLSAMLLSRTERVEASTLRRARIVLGSAHESQDRERFPKHFALQIPNASPNISTSSESQSNSDSD
ncbi:hypothetical protein BKA70DRAFT_1403242 [Coprinopsis sp. MPI-PUGE-AT-0042]|nr:hypothetical protein BKA70DRAFT_1403242 [Coprinopsis sp. MPI-PUGE-AT-0042]